MFFCLAQPDLLQISFGTSFGQAIGLHCYA
jgi:hypothetical protein